MKQLAQLGLVLAIAMPATALAQTPATHVVDLVDSPKTPLIHLTHQPASVNIGRVGKEAVIASVPYAYNQAIRLTSAYDRGLGVKAMPAGTMGFTIAPAEGQPVDKQQYYCLFGVPDDSGNPYAEPFCYVSNYQMLFGKLKVGIVNTSNNLMIGSSGMNLTASPPQIEASDAPIDHDFHLDISFKRWSRNIQGQLGITVVLRSEGRIVAEKVMAADSDNILRLKLDSQILTLKIDPDDQAHVMVGIMPAA